MSVDGHTKVYVIFDKNMYSKEDIVKIIKEEGYKHDFYFGNLGQHEFADCYLNEADEVWLFGNCNDIPDYQLAIQIGSDCWRMG